MLEKVRRQTSLLVAVTAVAILAASQAVAQAGPAGIDADTVDGRHAVGAGDDPSSRAGKLVATNASGNLPNNIIRKALDADLLDGLDSSTFARAAALRSDAGAVNRSDNPVHWKQLKGVPAGLADGRDSGWHREWRGTGELSPNGDPHEWYLGPFPKELPVMFQVVPTGQSTCAVFSARWGAWPKSSSAQEVMYTVWVDNEGQCGLTTLQPYQIYSVTLTHLSPVEVRAALSRVEATRVTGSAERARPRR